MVIHVVIVLCIANTGCGLCHGTKFSNTGFQGACSGSLLAQSHPLGGFCEKADC